MINKLVWSCGSVNALLWRIGIVLIAVCQLPAADGPGFAQFEDRLFASTGNETDLSLNIRGFRHADYAAERTGVFLTEKFDPEKIPVLLIHGLLSSPLTWEALTDSLNRDPEIRRHFQFWYYGYATSTPTVPAAAIMKRHLDAAVTKAEKAYGISLNRKMIVVGHSMGGVLAKSLVSSSGDSLWNTTFRAPASAFKLTEDQRDLMVHSFRYEPRPYVRSVIFVSTPHRGSKRANGLAGQIGQALAERPAEIEGLAKAFLGPNRHLLQPEFAVFLEDKVNSIATMRPDSPIANVLADMPIDPEVRYHTIAGMIRCNPKKGDGVVPLDSAKLDGSITTSIFQSRHKAHQTKGAIQLIGILLKREAGLISDSTLRNEMSSLPLMRGH